MTEDIRPALKSAFLWRGLNMYGQDGRADITGWWRDPAILGGLGPALAGLFGSESPTVVLAPQSRGTMLGTLVAVHLDVGMVELRKEPAPAADEDAWRVRTTPPDYRDRHLQLAFRKDLLKSGDRVLFIDDWIATGGQAATAQALVLDAGARWVGAAVIVDALETSHLRRDLGLRSLLHVRDL